MEHKSKSHKIEFVKFFSATAGIVGVAPSLNSRSGDPPRCGLGESARQGLTAEGKALSSFASRFRFPSGDRPTFSQHSFKFHVPSIFQALL